MKVVCIKSEMQIMRFYLVDRRVILRSAAGKMLFSIPLNSLDYKSFCDSEIYQKTGVKEYCITSLQLNYGAKSLVSICTNQY